MHLELQDVNFLFTNCNTLLYLSFCGILKLIGTPKYLALLSSVNQRNLLFFPQDHYLFFLEAHMAHDLC
jgi:hypothetical protein